MDALVRSVRLGGGLQVLIRAIMARLAAQATQTTGMTMGAEMRAAALAAEEVGAVIVLGVHWMLAVLLHHCSGGGLQLCEL